MRTRIPIAGIIGLAASAAAIGLWTAEQLTDQMVFEFLTMPFKLTLLAAPLFFLPELSAFLQGRPKVALALGLVLVGTTLCAMIAYLPWREAFTRHFSNSVYRWYYSDMPARYPADSGDFADWQKQWSHGIPQAIEAGLVFAYYGFIVAACALRRWGRFGGGVIAATGYAMLLLVPLWSGLIVWDYDTFLKGIAFDSISMDLFPVCLWFAGDYSIFLYVFMFIFFGVSAVFFQARPHLNGKSS